MTAPEAPAKPTARRPVLPWFQRRPRAALAVAVLLYAGVFMARVLDDNPVDALALLFCLPVALVAVAYGLRAGILAGLAGVALVLIGWAVSGQSLPALAWFTRSVPLLLLGGLLGAAVDQLRESERENLRLAEATRRHQQAVELNDSVVQRLSAARWALEAGQHERALAVLTETLESTQELIASLLRDADTMPAPHPPRNHFGWGVHRR